MRLLLAMLVALLLTRAIAVAQAPSEVAAAPSRKTVPAGAVIELELAETLSSRTSKIGQTFGLRLAQAIAVDGQTIIPAGAEGQGEVIDAGPGGFGGKPGKLVVAARYLTVGDKRMLIRGLKLGVAGKDYSTTAITVAAIPIAGVAALFINGGNVEIPAGVHGSAKVAADFPVDASPPGTSPAATEAPAIQITTKESTP